MLSNAWQRFRSWPTWAQVVSWVVLVIVVLSALGPDQESEVATTSPTTVGEVSDRPITSAEVPTTTAPAPTTTQAPTTAAAPQWVEVARLSGTAQKQGDTFELEGGKARLRYEFDAGQFGVFTAYVVEEGDSLRETGGFPVVTCTESCSDETLLRQPAGSYYLDVSATGSWTVVVEEER